MKLNIHGEYTISIPVQTMFLNTALNIHNHNLITLFGESFFLNRAINDQFTPITFILIGNGNNRPKKMDSRLGNETARKRCVKSIDLDKKQLIFKCNFPSSEILGTSEIGVSNGDILISHDTYEKIDEEFLTPNIGDVEIEYVFQLSTASLCNSFAPATAGSNIYTTYEPNEVIGVLENNTNSGYRRVNSLSSLLSIKGSYYYDIVTKNLYIRTTRDTNPNDDEIVIQTR